ncbi:putative Arylsulfatase [Seiridium cardinale]|uniref:Arylsulfatase n=1 Tax=Seiridium cardinale TaxID=138064 RepID=A0ABR2X9J6_9PEZI
MNFMMRLLPLALLSTALGHELAHFEPAGQVPFGPAPRPLQPQSRPNIVFILTDDQDLHMQSLDYMPHVQKHLINQGTSFKRHFCTTALCCPSRVTLWTGQAAHNTNVTNVSPPYGGYPKFLSQGYNDKYLPVWLQEAGYNTYYTGKLFNAHSVGNYHSPHAAGWTASDFLLDPFTYWYMNSTYQRNQDPPVSYEGRHSVEVLTEKALGLLDEAAIAKRPFFLGVAPVAPHANIWAPSFVHGNHTDIRDVVFSVPVPEKKYESLFKGIKVPRTENFNPDEPSGASWIKTLPKQTQENVDYNDHYYRQRLRALQSVDSLVDDIVKRLDSYGILDNTYIIYSTDNGYHIGQHRLQPAKQCSFEEDINIPMIIRGPNVPKNAVTDIVTTHTDFAPTLLKIAGAPLRDDFDGLDIPLTEQGLQEATEVRHEHVNVEHWGFASNEGKLFDGWQRLYWNNTYKALRVVSSTYNLHYQVWCNNDHELYNLESDPGQMRNLLDPDRKTSSTLLGVPLEKIVARLDSLLFVLKSCKATTYSDSSSSTARPTISPDSEANVAVVAGEPDSENVAVTVTDSQQSKPPGQVTLDRSSLIQVIAVLAIGETGPRYLACWIFISYLLSGVATQTLYAKLSDVYGRKWLLVFCYALFAIGLTIIGLAQSMWQVILGRAISGSGGSGMASIGLVLVTDLIPLREVATWHGCMNIINTTGRSLGGPVGGWLADQVGWRWSFLGQAPLFVIAIISCLLAIPNTRRASAPQDQTSANKVNLLIRIDIVGILLLGLSILVLMLPLELGGVKIPWQHPAIFVFFGLGAVLLSLFLATEAWWAPNPVFPIRMLKNREILACYLVIGLLAAAQTALVFSVPLYFQVTQRVSNTIAGVHLFPAVFGNAVGGLAAGRIIKRGLGAGMGNTAVFVSINAIVEPAHKAVAASGLYLSMPIGMITGIAVTSALMLEVMQKHLAEGLVKLGLSLVERQEVISKAAENVEYIYKLQGPVADAVARAYVDGLRWGYGKLCRTLYFRETLADT